MVCELLLIPNRGREESASWRSLGGEGQVRMGDCLPIMRETVGSTAELSCHRCVMS